MRMTPPPPLYCDDCDRPPAPKCACGVPAIFAVAEIARLAVFVWLCPGCISPKLLDLYLASL